MKPNFRRFITPTSAMSQRLTVLPVQDAVKKCGIPVQDLQRPQEFPRKPSTVPAAIVDTGSHDRTTSNLPLPVHSSHRRRDYAAAFSIRPSLFLHAGPGNDTAGDNMGWSLDFDTNWCRDIGYGVPAYCDYPDCGDEINRGLSFVCGGEPHGGERGCGLYFCSKHLHLYVKLPQLCERCAPRRRSPFERADTGSSGLD